MPNTLHKGVPSQLTDPDHDRGVERTDSSGSAPTGSESPDGRRAPLTIRRKVTIALVAVAFIPLLGITISTYISERRSVVQDALDRIGAVASVQEARVEAHVDRMFETLALVSSRTQLRGRLDLFATTGDLAEQEEMNRILIDARDGTEIIRVISLLGTDGVVVASTDPDQIGADPLSRPDIQTGSATPTIRTLLTDDGDLVQSLAGPVQLEGRLIGIMVIETSSEPLLALTQDPMDIGSTGETLIVAPGTDSRPQPITPPRFDPGSVLEPYPDANAVAAIAIAGTETTLTDEVSYTGEPVFAATRYIEGPGWGLVVQVTEVEALAPLRRTQGALLASFLAGTIVIFGLAWFGSRSITRPIVELTNAASAVMAGDRERRAEVATHDEMGILAAAFNRMTDGLTDSNAALAAGQARYRDLVDRSPVALWEIDLSPTETWMRMLHHDGIGDLEAFLATSPKAREQALTRSRIVNANPAALELIGSTDGDALLRGTPQPIVGAHLSEVVLILLCSIWDGRDRVERDVTVATVQGIPRHCVMHWAMPVREARSGHSRHVIAMVDVTERRHAEERLQELLHTKDEFVASVSHEIRTPLTAIVGYTDLLLEESLDLSDSERVEMLAMAASEASDMANIVEDLLVAGRSEIGGLHVLSVPVDVGEQIANVLEACAHQDAARISFAVGTVEAFADPTRVRQVLRNLITNALRYGGPHIRIESETTKDCVLIRVIDDGTAIPFAQRDHIFQPYQRSSERPGQPGSIGLGLTVARNLARLMGGDLSYRYEHAESIFELSLLPPQT